MSIETIAVRNANIVGAYRLTLPFITLVKSSILGVRPSRAMAKDILKRWSGNISFCHGTGAYVLYPNGGGYSWRESSDETMLRRTKVDWSSRKLCRRAGRWCLPNKRDLALIERVRSELEILGRKKKTLKKK